MTKYYIDAINGSDTNTGTTPDSPWQTIDKFTNNAVAGDVGVLKWNTTWSHGTADINPTNDGTLTSPIMLRAWDPDIDDDDASNTWQSAYNTGVKPKIDFEGSAYNFVIGSDDYWILENIEISNSIDNYGALYLNLSKMPILDGVDISGSKYGLYLNAYTSIIKNVTIDGSAFASTAGTWGLRIASSSEYSIGYNITIDGFYNAIVMAGGEMKINTLEIGSTTPPGQYDIVSTSYGSKLIVKGASLNYNKINIRSGYYEKLYIEDLNAVGQSIFIGPYLKWERDTTNYTGNATESIKVEPRVSIYNDYGEYIFEWKIINVTAAQHTVTVYVKGSGWTSFPTADELFIEVEYYDQATGTHTTTAKSTEVLTANDTWTAFTVTFTPAQDGDIYVRGYLKKYEDGDEVVWFNGEVEIT